MNKVLDALFMLAANVQLGAANKFLVALGGALVSVAAQGLLPEPYNTYASVLGVLLTGGLTYQVENQDPAESDTLAATDYEV